MKTQLVGWFFCALFCSSMAHDWIRGQDSIQEAKSNQLNRLDSSLLAGITNIQRKLAEDNSAEFLAEDIQSRTGGNPITYYCSPSNPGIIVIANVQLNLAILFDTINGIFCLCNGNTGTAVIVVVSTGSCYYSSAAWNANSVTLQAWVANITLSVIISLSSTVVVNVFSPSSAVLGICQDVLGGLDVALYIQVQANINICLSLAITLCTEIITCFNVNLLGLIQLTTTDFIVINGGLCGFVEICRGLIDLCVSADLDVQVLIVAGVSLEMQIILQAADGVSCFAYIAGIIGVTFNLVECLNVVITNITIFLRICVQLGGSVYIGVNGIFRVVAAVCDLTSGLVNLDVVLLIILNVCANTSGVTSITAAITAVQALIAAQILVYGNANGLIVLNAFISAIASSTCIIANINISSIIASLCGGVITTVLDLCIDIVVYITVFVTATITVNLYYATFLRVLLFCLNDISGRILINIIIPGLNIPIIYSSVCLNLLSGLLITILQVLIILHFLGLVQTILSITILKNIYTPCYNAIQAKTGLKLDLVLQDYLVISQYNLIFNWLQNVNNCGC